MKELTDEEILALWVQKNKLNGARDILDFARAMLRQQQAEIDDLKNPIMQALRLAFDKDELTREQIVLWAYEAGFPTNYARGEITRFETFARLVQRYLERDYK